LSAYYVPSLTQVIIPYVFISVHNPTYVFYAKTLYFFDLSSFYVRFAQKMD
jgi:hypothetical protein